MGMFGHGANGGLGIIGAAQSEARHTTVDFVCSTTRASSFLLPLARQTYLVLSGILCADPAEQE